MGGMWWSGWRLVVPGRTLCLKQEPYHKQTTTSPVISNPATHVHLLIMSIKSPQTSQAITHTDTHRQHTTPKRDCTWLGKVQWDACLTSTGRFWGSVNANTHRCSRFAHSRTSSPVNITSLPSIHPFECTTNSSSMKLAKAYFTSLLFLVVCCSKNEMLSSPGEIQLL